MTQSPPRVRLDGAGQAVINTGRGRIMALVVLFSAAFALLGARLIGVTLFGERDFHRVAHAPSPGAPTRADIVDRNGELLATSLHTQSLYADARLIRRPAEAAGALVSVLGDLDYAETYHQLGSKRGFMWLKRNLTPRQVYEVNQIGEPGFAFQREERRVYPHGALTAHAVGYTDIDVRGLAGAERSLDARLRDAPETPVALSLDLRFQHAMRAALLDGMARFSPKGAAGVVLDAETAEVLAMVSLPDFDPNHPGTSDSPALFNRVTLGVHEMGSTFKIITAAQALEHGGLTFADGFDATKPLRIARHTIRDFRGKHRWLALPEILMYSSNIGAARMALAFGADAQRDFLGRLGLLTRPEIEVGEVAAPITPRNWGDIRTATVAFGHGIAVSSLQLAAATAALVNGGTFNTPTLLRVDRETPRAGSRVVSHATSAQIRRLLRLVVTDGTGGKADVAGYRVGGKTGTAEKSGEGGYDRRRLLSSFLAVFPIDAPRFVVLVVLDEPQGTEETHNYATGGWTAAPLAAAVIERLGALSGLSRQMAPAPPETAPQAGMDQQRTMLGDEIRLAAH